MSTAYLLFNEEGHSFRKAESIKRSIDTELYFYSKIFGFEPAGYQSNPCTSRT